MKNHSTSLYLKRESATRALIMLLTDLDVISSRRRPFVKNKVWISHDQIQAFLHRMVENTVDDHR